MQQGDARSPFLCRSALRNGDFKQISPSHETVTLDRGSNRVAAQPGTDMQLRHRLIALILIATATTATQAATPATSAVPLTSCVDIGPEHEAFRFGPQYLLVHDGDSHYRLSFGSDCDALLHSASADIIADGKSNHLCAKGTKVSAGAYTCAVSSVDKIDADQYLRYRRRSR
jgi:hypothetical protein